MNIQTREICDHLENFVRSVQNQLHVDIHKFSEQVARIDCESSRPFAERRVAINDLSEQLKKSKTNILRLVNIVLKICLKKFNIC